MESKITKKISKKTFLGLALVLLIIIFAVGVFAQIKSHKARSITPGMFGEFYSGNWSFMNGSVGIGTTNPQKELDVNGSINVTQYFCLSDDCRNTWPSGAEGMLAELPKGSYNVGASYITLRAGWIYVPEGANQFGFKVIGGGNGNIGQWQMRFVLGGYISSTGTFGQYQDSQTMTLSQSNIAGWTTYLIQLKRNSGSTSFIMATYDAELAITG